MNIERLDRLLTSKQLTDETGISRSTIYRLLQNGAFPSLYTLGRAVCAGSNRTSKPGL